MRKTRKNIFRTIYAIVIAFSLIIVQLPQTYTFALSDTENTESVQYVETVSENLSVFEQMFTATSLLQLWNIMMAEENKEDVLAFTSYEITSLENKVNYLYDNLESPTEDDMEYRDMLLETLAKLPNGEEEIENIPSTLATASLSSNADWQGESTLSENTVWTLQNGAIITLKGPITIPNGVTLTLKGWGGFARYSTNINELFIVQSGGSLILDGISEEQPIIIDGKDVIAKTPLIKSSGTLNFESAFIQNGKNRSLNSNGKPNGVGGGIVSTGTLTMSNCIVTKNTASLNAGGINSKGTTLISNSVISYNRAMSSETGASVVNAGRGGGINLDGSNAIGEFTNVTIDNNAVMYYGGGAQVTGGASLTINEGTIFSNNKSLLHGAGGLHVTGGSKFYMNGGTFENNFAQTVGGAIHSSYECTLELNAGTIKNNVANGRGGGVHINTGGALTLNEQITISGNKVYSNPTGTYADVDATGDNWSNIKYEGPNNYNGYGGGVLIDSGTCTVDGATITGNEASIGGGGIGLVMINSGSGGLPHLMVVNFTMVSGTISDNKSYDNGAGVYLMSNKLKENLILNFGPEGSEAYEEALSKLSSQSLLTDIPQASVSGGTICDNIATNNGGALYMGNNTEFEISGSGAISGNEAVNGAGVYIGSGTANIYGGTMKNNIAKDSGGAVSLNDGTVNVKSGEITDNVAINNGGAFSINDGDFYMIGGTIEANTSVSGNGGAISVTGNNTNVSAIVRSGTLKDNEAGKNGGALSVIGNSEKDVKVNVVVGIKEKHFDDNGNPIECEHGDENDEAYECPQFIGNHADMSGGAIYVTGSTDTSLDVYCIEETESSADGDNGQSNFMKVEGGDVLFSTSAVEDENNESSNYGNIQISNTTYVTGGQYDIWGDMQNPYIEGVITVDIKEAGNYFDDHRKFDNYYKLIFYENFIAPGETEPTGQYKEYSIEKGTDYVIVPSIYQHTGYSIKGWNTDPNAAHNYPALSKTGDERLQGWYEIGQHYIFDESDDVVNQDLILYAIWERNGYTIIYDPNTDGNQYTGVMENQEFSYEVVGNLNLNQFQYPGYHFTGWNTSPDGSGTSYADEESVKNLTDKNGAIVTLYAQWNKCSHDDYSKYTYSVVNEISLKRECHCNGYYQMVTLKIDDTITYDQNHHEAEVVVYYSDPSVDFEWNTFELEYQKNSSVTNDWVTYNIPVNAGKYRVILKEPGVSTYASKEFEIKKAQQSAPNKPVYEPILDANNNVIGLKIDSINASPLISDANGTDIDGKETKVGYDSVLEYRVVHNGNLNPSWSTATFENGVWVIPVLDKSYFGIALTNYYVNVRFTEGTNYEASKEVFTDRYFNFGEVDVIINCGEGVDYTIDSSNDQLALDIIEQEGYYFPNEYVVDYYADDTTVEVDGTYTFNNDKNKPVTFSISSLPDKNMTITITLPNARKIPSINGNITEKEEFGKVTTNTADISRDSAYTAYYSVENYEDFIRFNEISNYGYLLGFSFSEKLPKDTTLILQDKTNKAYYWHKVGALGLDSIALTEFVRMGSNDIKFVPSENMELNLAVDFSLSASIFGSSLTTTLSAVPNEKDKRASTQLESLTTKLNDINVYLIEKDTTVSQGASQTFKLTNIPSDGIASKWDNRDSSLVVTIQSNEDKIPVDAHIEYTDGTIVGSVYINQNDQFIIPLKNLDIENLDISFKSKLLKEEIEFNYKVDWIVAHSIAELSPINGEIVAYISSDLVFKMEKPIEPSIKISAMNGKHTVLNTDDSFTVLIKWEELYDNCELDVDLMIKNDDGKYVQTSIRIDDLKTGNVNDSYEWVIPLASQGPGSYCVKANIMVDKIFWTETYYYFLIE